MTGLIMGVFVRLLTGRYVHTVQLALVKESLSMAADVVMVLNRIRKSNVMWGQIMVLNVLQYMGKIARGVILSVFPMSRSGKIAVMAN